ncbi:MAG: DinB family protein [Candidatus Rokubacteria bacterium]|nr:DinB family protein [Candidatus Rokubacteria bacterium]
MTDFDAALTGFAALDEEALGRPWSWRDGRLDVRYALYRTLEDAQEAYVRVSAGIHPESRRILALAQRAFGDLRSLLLGLPTDLLDTPPRAGEWPVRETLRHMLVVERRYALQTRYALERADAEPVRIPDDRLPTPAQMDVSGEIGAILARLGDARTATNRWLGDVAPAAMTRPTVWAHSQVDVRFRLHRFAAHVAEHTIQCDKAVGSCGRSPP